MSEFNTRRLYAEIEDLKDTLQTRDGRIAELEQQYSVVKNLVDNLITNAVANHWCEKEQAGFMWCHKEICIKADQLKIQLDQLKKPKCDHNFVSADNEVVTGAFICTNCKLVKVAND